MKIGIDARTLSTSRALFRYTKNIIDWLLRIDQTNDYTLLVDDETLLEKIPSIGSQLPGIRYKPLVVSKKILLRDHFFMRDTIKSLSLDLFFHPDSTEFMFCHERSVVTLHDLTPWKFPRLVLSDNPLMKLRQKVYFGLQKRALLRSSSFLIAVSENTKRDIVGILGYNPSKIAVIYEGIEEKFRPVESGPRIEAIKRKYKISGEYIFYLGGFEAHKNVDALVAAFGEVGAHNLKLVLGGKRDEGSERLMRLVGSLGVGERVIFPGFIKEDDLPELYSGAVLFVYPSRYEGFGFPPLEAMACGTPVILSNRASLPEVGGGAAIYVDPERTKSLVGGISDVLEKYTTTPEEYETLISRCLGQAKKFSWRRCALETLKVFEKVASF